MRDTYNFKEERLILAHGFQRVLSKLSRLQGRNIMAETPGGCLHLRGCQEAERKGGARDNNTTFEVPATLPSNKAAPLNKRIWGII